MGTNKMQEQKFNIQLDMELDEFRHLYYVFMKHGINEAYNDECNYGVKGKMDIDKRLSRKIKYLSNMVKKSTDSVYLDTRYHRKHDLIEIDKNGYQYKNQNNK